MSISLQEISKLRQVIFKITRLTKKQNGGTPFSATELNIIGHLDRNKELLPSELANLEHVSAQAISQNIKNLAKADFIDMVTDPADKRKTRITLSAHGKTQLLAIKTSRDEWFATAVNEQLGTAEIDTLKKAIPLLEKITDHLKH